MTVVPNSIVMFNSEIKKLSNGRVVINSRVKGHFEKYCNPLFIGSFSVSRK